jgi:hypothetical protein
VRHRERRHRGDEPPRASHQDQERQDEEQVVDAEQDVLDAQLQVGDGHLRRVRRRLHDERGRARSEAGDLGRAIEALEPDEHVGQGRGEPGDADRLPDPSAGAAHRPSLDEALSDQLAARPRHLRATRRELHVDPEAEVPAGRDLPEHLEGSRRDLP